MLLAGGGPASAETGSVSISLADAPASPRDPRAAFYVTDHVAPGTTLERAARVRNDGDAPVTVELYVGGATVEAGHLAFDDRQGEDAELARWASISPSRATIAPHADASVTVRFAVPAGARAGERLGVIWAQPPATGGATSVVNRVGVRVYLSVGDDDAPRSDFRIDALTASRDATGAPVITATVTNTGAREVEPLGSATPATDSTPTPFAPGLALLPGQAGGTSARLPTEPGIHAVRVAVELSANGVTRRAEADVTFPDRVGATAQPVSIPHGADEPLVTGPAIVAALLAAVALAGAVRATRRGSWR